jgi:hypothetical protein
MELAHKITYIWIISSTDNTLQYNNGITSKDITSWQKKCVNSI